MTRQLLSPPLLLFAFLVALSLPGCSPKQPMNVETAAPDPVGTRFVEAPGKGLVTLATSGFGKNLESADLDAVRTAFEAVLFRGVPQFTALSRPLVTDEQAFSTANPGYLDRLIDTGDFRRFVQTEYPAEERPQDKGKRVAKTITLDYAALRRDLEDKGQIRKFGY